MMTERSGSARVFRGDQCVCEHAEVQVSRENRRLGLTAAERCLVRVRFVGQVEPELRDDLVGIVERRGAAAERYADRIEPIVIALAGEQIEVRLKPPHIHRRIEVADTVFLAGAA